MTARDRHTKRSSFDKLILLYAFAGGVPGSLLGMVLLWTGDFAPRTQWTLTLIVFSIWIGFAYALRERIIRPLQTISNLLAALREEDYSIRMKRYRKGDSIDDVALELNALSRMLREQRLGALEATALLRKVMEETDVVLLAFDDQEKLRLINRAGERLLGHPAERLIGKTAEVLNLSACLIGESARVIEIAFPGSIGRWGMRRTTFRQKGRPHHLLVMSDLSKALRHEERQAWQRLIRVLGHEMNNSLAPMKSIAGSLMNLLRKPTRPPDWEKDLREGLSIISTRTDSLAKFMESYARLARLPEPQFEPVEVPELVDHVLNLETRLRVCKQSGPTVHIPGDRKQLEQLLINIIRNAVDASLITGGGVEVSWKKNGDLLEIVVDDEGPGLPNTSNLFVPFFTTKPGGSGIGLVLCRQIAEAHNGTLNLMNRPDASGCRATLSLPLHVNSSRNQSFKQKYD